MISKVNINNHLKTLKKVPSEFSFPSMIREQNASPAMLIHTRKAAVIISQMIFFLFFSMFLTAYTAFADEKNLYMPHTAIKAAAAISII